MLLRSVLYININNRAGAGEEHIGGWGWGATPHVPLPVSQGFMLMGLIHRFGRLIGAGAVPSTMRAVSVFVKAKHWGL